jgi:hypothetical protein
LVSIGGISLNIKKPFCVFGGNIEHFTIEDLYNAYLNTIAQILAMVGDLTDLTTTDKTSIVAAINEVVTTLTNEVSRLDGELADETAARLITGDFNYCENYWTYVDGVNGDDENDGLSSSAPFKTLEKALDKLNQRETSVVIRILTAGTYTCSKQVFNGITLHIQSEVDNVIIDFSDANRDVRIYNCHLNLACLNESGYLTLKNDYNVGMDSIYFENCATTLTRVKFTNHIICYGGNIESLNCQFRAVRFRGCNAWLADSIFNNDDVDQSAIQAYYSTVLTLTGSFTHNDTLPSNGLHGMIRVERALLFNAIINTSDWVNNLTTYKSLYGLSGSISQILITREIYYALKNYSINGENSHK